MITEPGMPLPLRDEGASLKQALADDTRARLRAACADVVNALFDSAALADDAQRHARTLQWLRTLRERGAAIIEALQTELTRSGAAAGRTPNECDLRDLLYHHFAVLDPQPEELALLEAVFRQRLLQAYPAIDPDRRDGGDGGDAATKRIVARLRIGHRDATPGGLDCGAPDPATRAIMTEAAPTAAAPTVRPRGVWHSAVLTVVASLTLLIAAGPQAPASTQATRATVTAPTAVTMGPNAAETAQPEATSSDVHNDPETTTASPPAPDTHATTDPPLDPLDATPAPPPTVTASAPQTASDPRLALQVDFLLRRADAALAALRLTEPFPDSAAANYTAVLALTPDNTRALEGLERVVAMYGSLVRGALASGNVTYASELFQRARSVPPASPLLAQMNQEIASAGGSAR